MIVISHRGHWLNRGEQNQESAFRRSFDRGFGIETDVRDAAGTLVISHDMPRGGEMTLDAFLALPGAADATLAINVKADGLAGSLREMAQKHRLRDWFVFDMSVPDMRPHFEAGNPVFTRMSEVEQSPVWLEASAGVWLDGFHTEWYDAALLGRILDQNKRVCVVSPELHARAFEPVWRALFPLRMSDGLMLCTDVPDQARRFFQEPE